MIAAVVVSLELNESVFMEILKEAMQHALATGSLSEDDLRALITKHGTNLFKVKSLGDSQASD